MRRRMGVLMMTLLLCSGCSGRSGAEEAAQSIRTAMMEMDSFSAQAEVTADYGDRVYEFTVDASGSLMEGSQTILEPENLTGVTVGWRQGGVSLVYDTVSLELGQPDGDGLSPADALPVILAACCSGALLESGWETRDEVEAIYFLTENPLAEPDSDITVALWADPESGALLRAEILLEGRTVVTYSFTTFQFT